MVRSGREETGEITAVLLLPGPGGLRLQPARPSGDSAEDAAADLATALTAGKLGRPGVHRRDPAAGAGPLDRGRRRPGRLEAAGQVGKVTEGADGSPRPRPLSYVWRLAGTHQPWTYDTTAQLSPRDTRTTPGRSGWPRRWCTRTSRTGIGSGSPHVARHRADITRRRWRGAGHRAAGAPLRHRQDEGRGGRAAGVRASAGPCRSTSTRRRTSSGCADAGAKAFVEAIVLRAATRRARCGPASRHQGRRRGPRHAAAGPDPGVRPAAARHRRRGHRGDRRRSPTASTGPATRPGCPGWRRGTTSGCAAHRA